MHYLETSVLVAYYLPEGISPKVQELYAGLDGAAICALTEVEFHSGVSRRVCMGELPRRDAVQVISQFRRHVDDNLYEVLPIEAREYILARDWLATFRTPLRTLDALHLAVAFSHGLRLVTADHDLARSAKHFGVKHRLIA